MVISEPVLACLASARARFTRPFASLRKTSVSAQTKILTVNGAHGGDNHCATSLSHGSAPDGLTVAAPSDRQNPRFDLEPEPLSATERRARAAALRGMLLARQRRFSSARKAFAEAITYDPTLDLASVPTFWRLERGGQEAAISAYQDQGREREASMLAARMRQTFRPRLVTTEKSPAAIGAPGANPRVEPA